MLGSTTHAMQRRSASASAMGLMLVLALAACGSGDAEPGALRLASLSSTSGETAALAAGSIRAPAGVPTPAPATTFPPAPAQGPVLAPSSAGVSTARVQALAQSLGITDPVVEKTGGWTTAADERAVLRPGLIVFKDARGTWLYGSGISCNLDEPATESGGCAVSSVAVQVEPDAGSGDGTSSSNGSTPVPAPTPPSATDLPGTIEPGTIGQGTTEPGTANPGVPQDVPPVDPSRPTAPAPAPGPAPAAKPVTPISTDAVLSLAQPVLTAAGITADAPLTYSPAPSATNGSTTRGITADPVVVGLPTVGISTTITVGPSPTASGALIVVDAAGTLGAWNLQDEYGVIDATAALKRLAELPQPAIAEICLVTPDGQGCAPRPTPTIVSARFGLMADTNGTTPILAPAWIYATTTPDGVGGTFTSSVAVSAVQDRYLATAQTAEPTIDTDQPAPPPVGAPGAGVPGAAVPGNPGAEPTRK